jgi:MoaA/NifB/PqqE/SkfB family radical SAM enzyme
MEIVHYISREKGAVSWLISNFKIMEKPLIERLGDAGLDFLTGSLDSLEGGEKGAAEYLLAKLDQARSRGIICSTLTVVQPGNLHEIEKIAEAVIKRRIIFDMGLCHNVGGNFSNKDGGLVIRNKQRLEELRRFFIRKKLLTGLIAPSFGYLTKGWKHYPEMSWKCASRKDKFLVVNNNGHLMACQEWPSSIPVLSINSLNSEKWRREKARLVENCPGCAYGCYFQKEVTGARDIILGLYSLLKT